MAPSNCAARFDSGFLPHLAASMRDVYGEKVRRRIRSGIRA
jgi:hypothetical protein